MNKPTNKEVRDYLSKKHYIDPQSDCWIWTGGTDIGGYPYMNLYDPETKRCRKVLQFHRYVYKLFKGKITASYPVIRHTCNNRNCVNPDHLICGTVADNVQDAIDSNTHISTQTKGKSQRRRFNDFQRADIRQRIANGESYYSIAKYYRTTMSAIIGYARRDAAKTKASPLNDFQRAEIQQRLAAGENVKDLAAYYGVKESAIRYHKQKIKEQPDEV